MKDEKHKKALEDIKNRGQQLLKQGEGAKKATPNKQQELKRIDSGLRKREEEVSPLNVFKDDIKAKGNAADPNVWPGEGQDIGLKIKNYIKDMNKLIDEEVKASGEDD